MLAFGQTIRQSIRNVKDPLHVTARSGLLVLGLRTSPEVGDRSTFGQEHVISVFEMLHTSYSFALAYEADLVAGLLERLPLDSRSVVLDPFCGTGTTLLESKLHGVPSIGVDANPVCVLVSRAKTEWTLNVSKTKALVESVLASASDEYDSFVRRYEKARALGARHSPQSDPLFTRSPAGTYLLTSGLIRRGWISPRPALKALLIAERLWKLRGREQRFLFLSLLGLLVPDISNMSYGPEIYKARYRTDPDVFRLFETRAEENLDKLEALGPQAGKHQLGFAWPTPSMAVSSFSRQVALMPWLRRRRIFRITTTRA